jgi:hypothetical protein
MSDALSFSGRFASASQILQEFVGQFERDVIELSRASSEMAESCRDRLQETWARWPELTEDFRKSVESLPRELRKHDFVKSALAEIERMESQARVFFDTARGGGHPHQELGYPPLVPFAIICQERLYGAEGGIPTWPSNLGYPPAWETPPKNVLPKKQVF